MSRLSVPHILFALLLAFLLPFEQGRCTCDAAAPVARHGAGSVGSCARTCCGASVSGRADAKQHPAPSGRSCACGVSIASAAPAPPALADAAPTIERPAAPAGHDLVAPVAVRAAHPAAADVGGPPGVVPVRARGLRAPPVAA